MTATPSCLLPLKGRRALVTGASSGIGEAIANRLAAAGATVIIVYRSHSATAKKTVANIEATGGEAIAFRADMAKERDIKSLFAQVLKKIGPLDILVNSAGMESKCPFLTMPVKDWDQVMSVNLRATFLCSQLAAQGMVKKRRGVIINISSVHAVLPWAGYAHYCASKAGVIMLTRALAKAWAPEITVNSVAPGVIPFADIDERGKRMIENTPARRGGTPAEIADAVIYFLKASNFVTGQILAIDGGLSQR